MPTIKYGAAFLLNCTINTDRGSMPVVVSAADATVSIVLKSTRHTDFLIQNETATISDIVGSSWPAMFQWNGDMSRQAIS